MKRIDYLQPAVPRLRLPPLPASATSRHALAAVGLTAFVLAASAAVEASRVARLQHAGVALTERLARADAGAAGARALQRELAWRRSVAQRVDATRRSGPANASEIAALGNRLPPDVWLTSLRIGPGAITLEGRSVRLEAIAAAMRALARSPNIAEARLVSAHDDALHGGVAYAIALDRRP